MHGARLRGVRAGRISTPPGCAVGAHRCTRTWKGRSCGTIVARRVRRTRRVRRIELGATRLKGTLVQVQVVSSVGGRGDNMACWFWSALIQKEYGHQKRQRLRLPTRARVDTQRCAPSTRAGLRGGRASSIVSRNVFESWKAKTISWSAATGGGAVQVPGAHASLSQRTVRSLAYLWRAARSCTGARRRRAAIRRGRARSRAAPAEVGRRESGRGEGCSAARWVTWPSRSRISRGWRFTVCGNMTVSRSGFSARSAPRIAAAWVPVAPEV